jgi:pyruvate formate lyase activating enzyme
MIRASHAASRRDFGLPAEPPRTAGGIACTLCSQGCCMADEECGYCGLRINIGGRLVSLAGIPKRGLLHWYRDPLPTNCVADWICQGHHQRGKHNLAVFYGSCTFNCLFCQNWHYRETVPTGVEMTGTIRALSAQQLAETADNNTFCVCYFGGDPASQMPHALASARLLARRGVVVCWETMGCSHPRLLERAFVLSLATGGCLKFDLKALDDRLHYALTGASNHQTLVNFAASASRFDERRPDAGPPLTASTLLVPGYVDAEEISRIARFIANIEPRIPYSLLAFSPQFHMSDLPRTSAAQARDAFAAARGAGLENVRIGNVHLLTRAV